MTKKHVIKMIVSKVATATLQAVNGALIVAAEALDVASDAVADAMATTMSALGRW
jgi:hypothetical protein